MPPQQRTKPKTKKHAPPAVGSTASSRRTLWIVLAGALVLGAALILGSALLGGGDGDEAGGATSTDTAVVDGILQTGTTLGSLDARVTLIQWEDFQCPFCRDYTENAFPALVDEYVRTGKVKIEFKGMAFIGPDSEKALRAALAAGQQRAFWQMEELLYANQGAENSGWVTDELIDELVAAIPGLDAEKFAIDTDALDVSAEIETTSQEAAQRGVDSTPSFFVSIDGAEPYRVQPTSLDAAAFRPILDDALAETG